MTAPPPAALAAAREIRQLLGLSGSHDSEVAAIIARHVAPPASAGMRDEKGVMRGLYDHHSDVMYLTWRDEPAAKSWEKDGIVWRTDGKGNLVGVTIIDYLARLKPTAPPAAARP